MVALKQSEPALYEDLTKILTPEEQSIIQNVVHQADALEQQHQAALQAASSPQLPQPAQQQSNGQTPIISEQPGVISP
jgi:importin-7